MKEIELFKCTLVELFGFPQARKCNVHLSARLFPKLFYLILLFAMK